MAKPRTVFVRDATGLVKQFSTTDVLLIAAALVFSLQAASVQFPWFQGFDPGADLRVALLIAAVPFILLMLVYWAAGVIMPRSGSDYVWVGRIFGPAVGFAWSAYYLLALFGAGYAASVVSVVYGLSSSMSIWGFLYNSPGLVATATWLSAPTGTFLLSTLLTLLFAVVALYGYRAIRILLYGGWVFAILGIALMWYYLSVTNPSSFAATWDSILSQYTSYEGILKVAAQQGWTPATVTLSASLASIPIAVLFLLGGNYVNAVSGEIKNVGYAVPISLLLSLFLGVGFWALSSTLAINAVGYNWMSAVGYLFDNAPAAWNSAVPYPPSMPLMLSLVAYPNATAILLIELAFVIGSFPTLFFYYWIPSRYFFAWGFDRILPAKISDVSERFRTPHWSIFGITAISVVYLVLFNFTSWPSAFAVATLIWFSSFILPSLAVAIVPFVKKDAFQLAPGFMKKQMGGIPMITIIGLLSTLSFSYMTYVSFLNPLLATVTTVGAYATGGVVLLALVLFYVSVEYHKRKGIDIRLAFKEIPPE